MKLWILKKGGVRWENSIYSLTHAQYIMTNANCFELQIVDCWISVCTVVSMGSRLTSVFKATVGLFVKKAAMLLPKSYNKEILQIKSCVTWLFEKVLNQWKIWNWETPNKTNSSEILWCYNSMSKPWGYEEMKNPDAKVNIGAVEAKRCIYWGGVYSPIHEE